MWITYFLMELSPGMSGRRTNSFVCLQEEFINPRERSQSQSYPTPQDVISAGKPTRFRRSSFALSGERQTTLDDLIDSASREATTAAAAQEAATLSALASPHPESTMLTQDEDGLDSKRVSVSTIIASQSGPSGLFHPTDSIDKSGRSSLIYPPGRNTAVDEIDNSFSWHNAHCPHSNLLNSEVIQNYLATLAVDSDAESCEKSPPKLATAPATIACENVPGLFQQSVASMTMPVQQIRRAHLSTSAIQHMIGHHKLDRPVKSMRCDVQPALTDNLTSSSCASDAEGWPCLPRGYVSDNPIDEADPRAKQLRLTGQRLEADFHRTKSLPRSPKAKRASPGSRAGIAEALVGYGTAPTSHNVSNFDLSHVYDGLLSSKAVVSTNSLNFEAFHSTLTPPSTPASSRSASSVGHDSGSSIGSGLGRIISLFDPFKPKQPKDNPECYIYMDEETSERRARARAANVISPVSF